MPRYFARLRGSGCAMSAHTRYPRAKFCPCRETGREALDVAWLSGYRIIVSCAEFPQGSGLRKYINFPICK